MKLTENNDLILVVPDRLAAWVSSGICNYIDLLVEVGRIDDAKELYQWYKKDIGLGVKLIKSHDLLEGR